MLVIMCHAGENRYAIDSADVIEVYRHDPGGWYAIRPP